MERFEARRITDVIRCSTSLSCIIPRVFQDDTPEDKKAIQAVVNQIIAYPLKDFTGQTKTIEWSKLPNIPGPKSTGEETKWVVPEKFFDQFGEVLETIDPLPGEQSLYGQFRLLLDTASKRPGAQEGDGRDRYRDGREGHPSFLPVEIQRTTSRQRLEPLDQQCAVRASTIAI